MIAEDRQTGVVVRAFASALFVFLSGCGGKSPAPGVISEGVLLKQADTAALQATMSARMNSTGAKPMNAAGLTGILGGARVKLLKAGEHQVILPIPQLADGQIPIAYAITTTPKGAGVEYRLAAREDSNVVVGLKLSGQSGDEIAIDWSAIVLLGATSGEPDLAGAEAFLQSTACVQSGAAELSELAERLWPANGETGAYAARIQQFVREMEQKKQPRSMDALGILESGGNWICTANANLAAALLRSKGIPARLLATAPPNGQRLEMHRIVEFRDGGQWVRFDPSLVHADIPMKPWQHVIMARTTIADEEIAMKPRLGTALGCPYGQELEITDPGVSLFGPDFFWTVATGLAEFEIGEEAARAARAEWLRFLESGELSEGQITAASAANAAELSSSLNANPES